MSLLSLVGASRDFGLRSLFTNLDLHIGERERLGLIGPNGAGKSTLLRVLAGEEPLDRGERRAAPTRPARSRPPKQPTSQNSCSSWCRGLR